MTKPVIGSRYQPAPRSYERRTVDGQYHSFMEFPSGHGDKLQASLLNPKRSQGWLARLFRSTSK